MKGPKATKSTSVDTKTMHKASNWKKMLGTSGMYSRG